MPNDNPIELNGVTFSPDWIITNNHRIIATNLQSLAFQHGFLSKHPLFQILFGTALLIPAAYLAIIEFRIYQGDAPDSAGSLEMMLFLLVVGTWAIFDALRRGNYCEVITPQGRSKIAFKKRPTQDQLNALEESLTKQFNWKVTHEIDWNQRN